MNEAIIIELRFFVISILWGSLILIIYDCLRIIRKIIKHNKFSIAIEDLFYWIICGLLIFKMMYKHNDGIIRAFSIMGMLIGMIIYKNLFSDFLLETISAILIKILNFGVSILSFIIRPFLWLKAIFDKTIAIKINRRLKKVKNSMEIAFKSLKSLNKSSKIPLSDVKDGDLLSEEEKSKKKK